MMGSKLMNKRSFIIKFIFLTMIYFLLSSRSLAVMKGLDTEELTRESESVITGEVENTESRWSKDGRTIFTKAFIVVNENIKGKILQKRITVEYEGGEIGDIGLKISDVAPLEKGENVLLFLKSGKSKSEGFVYNIVGKAQGKYTIDKDRIARKRGFSVIRGEDIIDNNIPLDDLIKKIRKVK
jgi:hypothetical protein